ncbi:hypothetical protein EF912_27670 [Streptomyces sp. WAC07061]|uniref:hypothetical protein n=1 Tax=Streptomyces sp. WAC07061 TaxID=2487410 RepID=UPI000F76618C|nr:hypothetical protein [Streptomyces sp. WAC07061]RSS46256.1 hypothetical protein EF912_27670 [Streptomyces sp. WAC07061]
MHAEHAERAERARVLLRETWGADHRLHAARPTPDRPDGAIIATTEPKRWAGGPARILDLSP